jgi:hypothetical protein
MGGTGGSVMKGITVACTLLDFSLLNLAVHSTAAAGED